MAEGDPNSWLLVSAPQQAEMHLPGHSEPVDVVWVSGSTIIVGPTNDSPSAGEPQPETQIQESANEENADTETDNYYEISDAESDATIEYQSSQPEEPGAMTVTESETGYTESDESGPEEESNQANQEEAVSNIDGNSILIIQHENPGEQIAQEPNVVTLPENVTAGVENPIIRLENPDYEPEPYKSATFESPRVSSKRSYGMMISEEEDDGQTCPVCFDDWTNAGEHRLSALKCGHLFGKSCIIRWLTKEKKKYCPQCNKKAHPNDVRELYATKLTALDATERTRLEKELQIVKDEKRKLEFDIKKCNLCIEMYKEQLEAMKLKVAKLSGDLDSKKVQTKTDSKPAYGIIKFYLEKTFEINEGCCRVCAYDSLTNVFVVSHQTRNQLFPGYGIKKIQKVGTDYFGNNFLYLHAKALRDLSFHPVTPNLILTVSFDRCAKLADLKEHSVLHTFKADYPLWSCCWDTDDPNYFYAGAGNGCVHVFDIRTPTTCAAYLNPTDDSSAVVSVRYAATKTPFKGGIICCRLNSITLYEKTGPVEFNPIPLNSLAGPFFSLSYDPGTQHILASCRPSEDFSKVRHVYCELNGTECRKVFTFCGGTRQTLLSRSCFVRVNNEILVAVFQENTNTIDLWSTSTGSKVQSIPVSDQILDFTAIQMENRHLIGTVSDSLVRFYETSSIKSKN